MYVGLDEEKKKKKEVTSQKMCTVVGWYDEGGGECELGCQKIERNVCVVRITVPTRVFTV